MTACSLLIAVTLTGASMGSPVTAGLAPIAVTSAPVSEPRTQAAAPSPLRATPVVPEGWTIDRPASRPAALPVMYAALGALQALDVYSTRRAIGAGAHEVNPLTQKVAANSSAMLAAKVASSAVAVYFVERAWKKNRKGAIVMMAIINGATAAIVARNMRNAR
jgi:hypothetical protein